MKPVACQANSCGNRSAVQFAGRSNSKSHVALRRGIQRHVAVADKYYAFTRETEGERLFIVFHSGESSANVSLDLADTTMAGAKRLTAIFGGSTAQLEGTKLDLQLAPLSLTVYKVD